MKSQDNFFKTQIRIPADIYGEIKDLAEDSDRSINGQIVHLFRIALGQSLPAPSKDELKQLIKEAIRDELANK